MSRVDRTVGLGLALVVVSGVVLALTFGGFTNKLVFGSNSGDRIVKAKFADAQQLHAGDPVRIDGVEAGLVDEIVLDDGARSATVSMALKDGVGPLYKDASAEVRWRLALGANFQVRLKRGTPGSGDLGDRTIPRSRTSKQVELEDITSIDQGAAETGLKTMPGELAEAFSDRKVPKRAVDALADAGRPVAKGLRGVRGLKPDRDLRRLVKNSAEVVAAVDSPTDDLRDVVTGAAATLETTAARQDDLRETLARAPGVMRRTDQTLTQLDDTLRLADPVVAGLQEAAPDIAPTLARLRPTVAGADRLVRRAVPPLLSLRPSFPNLAETARQAKPLLDELEPGLVRLDDTILPYLAEVKPESQRSTTAAIGGTFAGLGPAAAGQQDQNGHFIRFPSSAGSSSFALPCQVYLNNPDKEDELAECQSLQEAMDTLFSSGSLPPGTPTPPPLTGGIGR